MALLRRGLAGLARDRYPSPSRALNSVVDAKTVTMDPSASSPVGTATTSGPSPEGLDSQGAQPQQQQQQPHSGQHVGTGGNILATQLPAPYYVEDGFLRVRPYWFTYKTYCKERWRGRRLIDVFEAEFRDRPLEYYRMCMETGKVQVDGKPASPDQVMKNGQFLTHTIHRHEPPVTADPIGIVHEDDGMIVINKPAGMPVHPAGRYNYNSVLEVLKAQRPGFVPKPCNRLDRLTSGIMFIGKTSAAAMEMSEQIFGRAVRKEYLARVHGRFPEGEVVCTQPILQISPKLGLNRVRASGKPAKTVFKRLAYYGPEGDPASSGGAAAEITSEGGGSGEVLPWTHKKGYSIVRCLPVTGRTHQIRVHLQFLGHPVQNDPIYANQRVWGLSLGAWDGEGLTTADADVIARLERMGKEDVASAVAYYDEMLEGYEKKRAELLSGEYCPECDTPLYTDPDPRHLRLWLHSLRYEAVDGSWSYTSPLPDWALPPPGVAGPTSVDGMADLVGAAEAAPKVEEE